LPVTLPEAALAMEGAEALAISRAANTASEIAELLPLAWCPDPSTIKAVLLLARLASVRLKAAPENL
jgi:hypothetical protein